MKNKEKYEKQILTFACKSESFGVDEETREIEECIHIKCTKCKFYVPGKTCEEHRREWSDSEPWLIEDLKKLEVVEEYEK